MEVHTHDFQHVVRRKGSRVRYICAGCAKIGPWIRFVDEQDAPSPDLDGMTVSDLRAMAKQRGLVGYSKQTKATLVERLGG